VNLSSLVGGGLEAHLLQCITAIPCTRLPGKAQHGQVDSCGKRWGLKKVPSTI
jgi:hypothetical protein